MAWAEAMVWTDWLSEIPALPAHWHRVVISSALVAGAIIAGLIAHRVAFAIFRRLDRHPSKLTQLLMRDCRAPLRLALPIYAIDLVTPLLRFPSELADFLQHLLGLLEIAAITWLFIAAALALSESLIAHYQITETDEFRARRIVTQIRIFRRILLTIIAVLAVAIGLMSFRWGKELGGSILASAGIAGLAVGLAARPTVENLVAGVQLAITQPIRLEDVVIVENEWGWIEEITTTYVVVRIWDLRRLILPLTYFSQHSFQNWTRQSAELMGTVHLYVDYTVPVQAIRQELVRLTKGLPQWDGKVCVLQVTHATEHSLELRALVSAKNSSLLWDLRCAVREQLLEFVQRNYPQCLPKTRAELASTVQARDSLAVNAPSQHR
jgi:small-conductance mechanosensitive channel